MNTRRHLLLHSLAALAASTVLLAGCGGGDDDDSLVETELRLVNATSTIASADLYRNDDRIAAGVARNGASGYSGIDDGSAAFKVTVSGQTVGLATNSDSLEDKRAYTALAWGRGGAVNLTMLADSESKPDSGYGKLRVFSAAPDAGELDIYLTDSATELDQSSPVAQITEAGKATAWNQLGSRSYRLRVTAAGDPSDLRLDVADFPVGGEERITLVLQPGASGVLVHGLKLVQRGAVTAYANTGARLRLVASVADMGRIGLSLGGSTLVQSLSSPSITAYLPVAAGTSTPQVRVGDALISAPVFDLAAGTDYSLMVYGPADAAQVAVLVDDNRLPTTSGRTKLRLVNGVTAQPSLGMTLDAVTVAGAVPPGEASSPLLVQANPDAVLEVFGASATPIFSTATNPIAITGDAVYTFFLLDGAATPADRLRRDR